jgi:hypothetical protein
MQYDGSAILPAYPPAAYIPTKAPRSNTVLDRSVWRHICAGNPRLAIIGDAPGEAIGKGRLFLIERDYVNLYVHEEDLTQTSLGRHLLRTWLESSGGSTEYGVDGCLQGWYDLLRRLWE